MKQRTILKVLMAGTIVSVAIYSCKGEKPVDAEINKSFEMTPPVAKDIQVKLLEKPIGDANILVTAMLDPKIIKSNLHAVMVNDEKLILRDDGKKGDEKAGDGIYSIALKEDEKSLQKEFDTFRQAGLQRLQDKKPIFQWVNRSAIPVKEKLRDLFMGDEFNLKKGLHLDFSLPFFPLPPLPAPVSKERSLMVTDLGVVEDPTRTFNPCAPAASAGTPNGAWTFGKLMTDMANGTIPADDFVKSWLDTWMTNGNVNSDPIPARTSIFNQIILPWVQKSNPAVPPASITATNWKTFPFDLKFAPFKLLAIVNRIDLRGNSGYTISNAGEGRFVFGALSATCSSLPFTVIFEYGIPKKSCSALKTYAQQWYDLTAQTPGTPAYNNALQAITNQFTAAGAGGAAKANGSSLNQVRTNEIILGNPWELREFNIDKVTHKLFDTTVKQEPAKKFNRLAFPTAAVADQTTLATYVNTNEADIIANNYAVPLSFSNAAFLGGKAHTELPTHFWDAAINASAGSAFINNGEARHVFSLNTCSGCHGGETSTFFLQVAPQPFGAATILSRFLTGDPGQADGLFKVTDPAGRPTGSPAVRGFNDLERRAEDLATFVSTACNRKRVLELIRVLRFKPVRMSD